MRPLYIVELLITVNNIKIYINLYKNLKIHLKFKNVESCTKIILWRFNVAGDNKSQLGFHVKCPIFLSNFNQIWISYTE